MDFFGIGQMVTAVVEVAFRSGRQTGRTTTLVESLKDGDRVICPNSSVVRHVEKLCKQRGLDVQVLLIPPGDAHKVLEYGTAQGRCLFEHTWVEEYYRQAISRASNEISHLQASATGYDYRHIETRERYAQACKWDFR